MIKSISVLGPNGFEKIIPFSVDLDKVEISPSLKAILDEKNVVVTDNNIEAVIAALAELNDIVGVNRGGTGKDSITEGSVLVGGADNTFEEREFDSILTLNSDNLVTSGLVYEAIQGTAPKDHASTSSTYGIGDVTKFGHLKLGEGYKEKVTGEGVSAAHNALVDMYTELAGKVNSKIVTDDNGNITINYSDNTYEEVIFTSSLITDTLYKDSTKAEVLESSTITFNNDGSIDIEEA